MSCTVTTVGVARFVRDPELRNVGQTQVCEFSLAYDETRKSNGEQIKMPTFIDCVVWDKAAGVIAQYGKKGDRLYFVATPRQENWTDKTTGAKRSKLVFRITDFSFIGDKGGGQKAAESEQPAEEKPAATKKKSKNVVEENNGDDGVPF